MKKAVVYIHGKGGSAGEAAHYKPIFREYDVLGFDYAARTPWEARREFPAFFSTLSVQYDSVSVLGNSLGAFLAMDALRDWGVERAWFISPVVDMARLITDMMRWAGVGEEELRARKEVETAFGETLSWEYLREVREHPLFWRVPTEILYGSGDTLVAFDSVAAFAKRAGAALTVMEGGEHWFHTEEQMAFLDRWLTKSLTGAAH